MSRTKEEITTGLRQGQDGNTQIIELLEKINEELIKLNAK